MDRLPEEGRDRWAREEQRQLMVEEALKAARLDFLEPAVAL